MFTNGDKIQDISLFILSFEAIELKLLYGVHFVVLTVAPFSNILVRRLYNIILFYNITSH
jgi:hypothetical protein